MKALIESYINWLKQKIYIEELENFHKITTPFVDHINDYIQFYLKRDKNGNIHMTDDGYMINNLEMSGVDINSPGRKKELESILNGFGVISKGNELTMTAMQSTFPMRKHNFIQALMAVDDLYVISTPKVEKFFLEDVINFLKEYQIRFSQNIILQGKSSFQHKFDILIPLSNRAPERIIKVVNSPKKQNIITQLFAFEDTKQARNNEGIMVLNDLEQEINPDISQAINEYGILEIPWTKRNEYREKLTA